MYLYKLTLVNGNVFHATSNIDDLAEFIKKAEVYFNQKIRACECVEMTREIN